MNIVIFGATGMVGSRVVTEASSRGHQVIAASRRGGTHASPAVTTAAVDAGDREQARELLNDADVVVGAIRPRPGEEGSVPETTATLLDAAAATGSRLLLVGGSGPLASPDSPTRRVIDDERFVPAEWRASAEASLAQLRACEGHQAAWTYLSPPALLEPGTRTSTYRRGTTTLLVDQAGRSGISAEDLAVAILDEIEQPGDAQRFTVAY